MKYINIIKLLSVLLCIVVLFASCAKTPADDPQDTTETTETDSEVDTEPKPEEEPLTGIESKFENFFEVVANGNSVSAAMRVDGEIVSIDNSMDFFVLKNVDIDSKNNVTETYKLYNAVSGEVTLTFTNTYFNGNYDSFSWDDLMVKETVGFAPSHKDGVYVKVENSKKYHEKYLDVYVKEDGDISYVVVRTATVTPIDDKVREENEDACVYNIETKYQYYDVYGTLIAESNGEIPTGRIKTGNSLSAVRFGATIAYFDIDTEKLVSADSKYDTDKISGVFSYENDDYGYFLNGMNDIYGLGFVRYIEIFDKAKGEVAYRYYLNDNYEQARAYLLHNGDVLIQYRSVVDEKDPYNCYDQNDDRYYSVAHEIFSVRDGKAAPVELGYYISNICDGQEFFEDYAPSFGVNATENARNVAYARPFDKEHMGKHNIYVFDNDMTLVYEYGKLIPEHNVSLEGGFGVELLDNGEYLVDLDDVVTHKAIVKADGTVRTYIPRNMSVAGGFIYDDKNIYDYDLNPIYSLKDMYYEVCGEMFGKLILRYKYAEGGVRVTDDDYAYYYVLEKDTESGLPSVRSIFYAKIVGIGEDHVIIRRGSDEKYVFLNDSYKTLLVTYNEMYVSDFDGGYIALTNIEGHQVLYKIN